MQQTHTVVLELLLVLVVQQGQNPVPDRRAAAHVLLAHAGSTGQVQGQDADLVLPTPIRLAQDLPRALRVLQGPGTQVLEQHAAAHVPLVQLGSTGPVQGLGAGPAQLITIAQVQELLLVLGVLLEKSLVRLDQLHQVLVTMVMEVYNIRTNR